MATRDAKGRWVKGHPQVAGSKLFLPGNVPWNKGKTMSEEFCRKNSEAHKGLQAGENNPMYGRAPWIKGRTKETCEKVMAMSRKTSASLMGHKNFFVTGHSEESRRKISEGLKGHKTSEATKRKMSEKAKKRWEDPEIRERYMKSLALRDVTGEKNHFYGKKHSEEAREKMSLNHPDLSGENNPMWGTHMSEHTKKLLRDKARKRMKNPEYVRKLMKAINAKPNKAEIRLLDLLQQVNPAWRYVGDGSLVVDGKLPDFWDGDKKLCEHYGTYWHAGDDPQERIDFFKQHGYDCLVVWESELSDPAGVLAGVESFGVG